MDETARQFTLLNFGSLAKDCINLCIFFGKGTGVLLGMNGANSLIDGAHVLSTFKGRKKSLPLETFRLNFFSSAGSTRVPCFCSHAAEEPERAAN